MSYKIPSLSETREFLVALFKGMFPDRNSGALRAYHVKRLTVVAGAATQIHAHVKSAQDDVMPDTAGDGAPVERWGNINGTGTRKGATAARKSAAGRVRGSLASVAPSGATLLHDASGNTYALNQQVTIPAALYYDADIIAISKGADTRLLVGEVLEFVNVIPGIETQVVLQKGLDEDGFDEEQYGAYRKRMLDTFGEPTAGGNNADYKKWALELTGVDQAFCYANRAGVGTIDVVGLHTGTGSARILTTGEAAALLTYLKTKAPSSVAGIPGALRVLTAIADPQIVEVLIAPNGDAVFAFDWSGAPLTITAYNAGTREVTFSTNLPSSMKAGHRVVIKGIASVQDGKEIVIEALSAVNKIILQDAPIVAPVNTDLIYSGGPLVTPIRAAILAHINGEDVYAGKQGTPYPASSLASTVGLEVLAEGIGPANPAGVYGTWTGGLLRAALGKIAIYKAGVRNYSIALPVADYEATDYTYPNDIQIGLVTASRVLVRSA
jgi:hypothetical protein